MNLFRRNKKDTPEPTPAPAPPKQAELADTKGPAEGDRANTDSPLPDPPNQAELADKPPAEGGDVAPLQVNAHDLKEQITEALRSIFDPEIPVNIYDLGLIYNIDINDANHVDVKMTLTSPNCPEAGTLPGDVERKVKSVPGVQSAKVDLVWDPPFSIDMMSEAAKLQLNLG